MIDRLMFRLHVPLNRVEPTDALTAEGEFALSLNKLRLSCWVERIDVYFSAKAKRSIRLLVK